MEAASEIIDTRGRLRGLLHANQVIVADLALPVVLRRIAEAARDLVGARYAALGVIGSDGGLAEFITVGIPQDGVALIGDLPQGKGLLGALIDDPEPIRLHRITDDPRSSGFPPGHPPMSSFLGVPIRVRGEIFGNLYLTESTRGDFTAEDQELAKALAATAGAAIDNARLYATARARQDWLQATALIIRALLTEPDGLQSPLQLIAERSREMAQADLVVLSLPSGDNLRIEVATGMHAEELVGQDLPLDSSLAGRAYTTRQPLRLSIPDEQTVLPNNFGLEVGPRLSVPLLGTQRVHGVLGMARKPGRPNFTDEDLDMIAGLANQAALALELADARAAKNRAALFDERDRIAVELHHQVIQRLFGIGLLLQSVAGEMGPGRSTERVLEAIRDLDDTAGQVGTAIFSLSHQPDSSSTGLRARVLDVVSDVSPALGFEPVIQLTGMLDTLAADLADDLLAVLRESLTSIARHAHAHGAQITLACAPNGVVTLDVDDDGTGVSSGARGIGVANLRHRAERRGGHLSLEARLPSGTHLSWSVPSE